MGTAISNKSCDNCRFARNGACGGVGPVCGEFEAAYNISPEELALWPTGRDRTSSTGVHYRSQAKRLKGEFRYPQDRSFYAYEHDAYGQRRYC